MRTFYSRKLSNSALKAIDWLFEGNFFFSQATSLITVVDASKNQLPFKHIFVSFHIFIPRFVLQIQQFFLFSRHCFLGTLHHFCFDLSRWKQHMNVYVYIKPSFERAEREVVHQWIVDRTFYPCVRSKTVGSITFFTARKDIISRSAFLLIYLLRYV